MTTPNPVVLSIVTVVLNAEDKLRRCIESIISQTYQAVELIIIDGASTDGTVEVIKQFAKHIAYWVSEKDEGIFDAMNKGIKAAHGDYIFFLGSDDCLLPDSLEKLFSHPEFTATEALIALPVKLSVKAKNFIPDTRSPVPLVHHQGAIFHLTALKKIPLYSKQYKIHSDLDLMVRYVLKNSIKYIPVPISEFYKGGNSSCGRTGLVSAKEQLQIYFKYKGRLFDRKFLIFALTPLYYWLQFLGKKYLLHELK